MKSKEKFRNIGIVWYTEKEWRKMKDISSDSEKLEDSFIEWKKMAEKSIKDMKAIGIIATKVLVKAEEFSIWCKIHSMTLNSGSRAQYVSDILSKRNNN